MKRGKAAEAQTQINLMFYEIHSLLAIFIIIFLIGTSPAQKLARKRLFALIDANKNIQQTFFECSECSRKREEKPQHTVQHNTIEVSRHSEHHIVWDVKFYVVHQLKSNVHIQCWNIMGRKRVFWTQREKRLFAAFWFGNWMKWASAYANKRNKGECELLCKLRGELSSRYAVWAAQL